MNIDNPPTNLRAYSAHILGKFQMAVTVQRVNRSPSCLVLRWGFQGRRIERRHFRLDQIQYGGWWPFWKTQTIISLKRILCFTLCMYTDHTLPSDSIMTVDAYDRRLNTYFVREGIKRNNEKTDLEKITCKEYTLDWSQSKVFLVCQYFLCLTLTEA